MSSPSQPSGSASNGATCVSASSANSLAATTSVGSTTGNESGFSSRSSSAIFPPTSTSSARPPRFSSTPSLSSTLAPPVTSTNGPLDLAEQPAEMLELGEQEQPGVGGQQLRDADRRGVRAVRRAEGVVDEEVAARRPAPARTPGRSPSRRGRSACSRAPRSARPAAARAGARAPARSRNAGSSPFGRPRCEQTRTRAAPRSSSSSQRRQRGADARVVGDPPVLERDVQVGADEDAPCRRRPRRGPSAAGLHGARAACRDQVDEPARVAPLVVVPAEDLGHACRSPSSARCRRCTSTASG